KFRHLTTDDGLPNNKTSYLMKDSRGFIWITTSSGLCRYDGNNIKVFQYDPDDSTSLSDNHIYTNNIIEDTEGYLWIGTANGLNKYDHITGTFKRYKNDPDDPNSIACDFILCLYIDRYGALWIGMASEGD
ncbi:MAG: hypothetical protein K8R74_16845, partial [Bacteroidales bacterium]|nr:hypothetical protein [Bacteroidales bacterium]